MIEKQNLEAFLKANGVKATDSDEEIRSVLISARWDHKEIDTALIVLKENLVSHETHIDTLHKVFNTDSRLSASEISTLLGVQVSLSSSDVNVSVSDTLHKAERGRMMLSFLLTLIIASVSIGYVIYSEHTTAKKVKSVQAVHAVQGKIDVVKAK